MFKEHMNSSHKRYRSHELEQRQRSDLPLAYLFGLAHRFAIPIVATSMLISSVTSRLGWP